MGIIDRFLLFRYNELSQQESIFEKYPELGNYMPHLKVFTLFFLYYYYYALYNTFQFNWRNVVL